MPWSELAKIVPAGAQPNDEIGRAVSVDGNYAAIGAPGDDTIADGAGAVYIYFKTGGVWTFQQKIFASDAGVNIWEGFGTSVSLDGTSLIVGAIRRNEGGTYRGAAYVFTRTGSVWTEQQKLVPSTPSDNHYFGDRVSISGDYCVVIAPHKGGTWYLGTAYVFKRTGAVWAEQQQIAAATATAFGWSVDLEGDVLAVGATLDGSAPGKGAVYVYRRSGVTWPQEQRLAAGSINGHGASVGISGNTIVVGVSAGAALPPATTQVWFWTGSVWAVQQTLSEVGASGYYGGASAVDTDTIVVGDQVGTGTAYIYTRSGVTWTKQQQIFASDPAYSHEFGRWPQGVSVTGDGSDVFVGARAAGPGTPPGAAYAYAISDTIGPLVVPTNPVSDEINVDVDTNVTLEISDESGIDLTTLQVEVDRGEGGGFELAFEYDGVPQFKPGWDGGGSNVTEVAGTYTIIIDPTTDFAIATAVRPRVTALDTFGNPARL